MFFLLNNLHWLLQHVTYVFVPFCIERLFLFYMSTHALKKNTAGLVGDPSTGLGVPVECG